MRGHQVIQAASLVWLSFFSPTWSFAPRSIVLSPCQQRHYYRRQISNERTRKNQSQRLRQPDTPTTLHLSAAEVESAALGFFNGIRTPSALLVGTSLTAFFTLVKETKKPQPNRMRARLIALYHVLALVSLLLSLNVVITATAAGAVLLLDDFNAEAVTPYVFMKNHMFYELLTTRWSFYVSLLSFLGAVTTRALIEFDLLERKRRKQAAVFLFSMGALVSHLISFINSTLYSSPNLAAMTVQVFKVVFVRAVRSRNPLDLLSVILLFLAASVGASMWWRDPETQD
ncbi:expressed unknown protein [Seminavis robusta]|uniref:Uncharacterized protein n=1 Tax=Seminavis robusta TaxID=568900 RepID=A0A9N8E348_9STRA|nr:expressed unknown protein [Seminavis robusta]|eukprot:Sro478_g150980.1 n/a (286) ;mRNA; r:14987-15970